MSNFNDRIEINTSTSRYRRPRLVCVKTDNHTLPSIYFYSTKEKDKIIFVNKILRKVYKVIA